MSPQLEIQIIAVLTAVACSLIGVFLVLRKSALISEAISHSVMFGVVTAYIIAKSYSSIYLITGAVLTGLLTVIFTEMFTRNKLIKRDSAIGLIYPLLFSVGIILLTKYAYNVHIDTNSVLLGEIIYAPFNRVELFGFDIGSVSLITISIILVIDLIFIILFFKELKITSFEPEFAKSLGISTSLINYSFITLVSVTIVGAFDSVGSILVISLIIVPPATAYLISKNLIKMIIISVILSALAALSGYWTAHFTDASVSGAISVIAGSIFLIIFIFRKVIRI